MKKLLKACRPALICLLVMIVLCGIVYTGVVTGIAQMIFPNQANGSIITVKLNDGTTKEYGSELIAQEFTKTEYFIGRPSGVTNLSPVSSKQEELISERIEWWHTFDPDTVGKDIPSDLLTASGSGCDPNITPEAAEFQIARVAKARNMSEDDVREIVKKYTSGRFLGFIGEPAVNVLKVNLALDGLL